MKRQAQGLRKGDVVVSSGQLKLKILDVQYVTDGVVTLTAKVVNSRRPKAPHMHGKTYVFDVPSRNEYTILERT